jgi:hypothetical protein
MTAADILREQVAQKAGKAPGNDQAPGTGPLTREVILEHWKQRFDPIFRRWPGFWSAAEGRVIRPGEAGIDFELIERLAGASDAPRTKHGVDRDGLPGHFEKWRKTAWGQLLRELPPEPEAPPVAAAADEFRRQVAAALHTPVQMARDVEVTRGGVTEKVQRRETRSLIQWADLWAKPNRHWERVRTSLLWCRRNPATQALEVAFRRDLFSQTGPPDLARLGQADLSELCQLYEVGTPDRAGGQRAVVLAASFVRDLLACPADEAEAEAGDDTEAVNPNPLCHNAVDAVDGEAGGGRQPEVPLGKGTCGEVDGVDGGAHVPARDPSTASTASTYAPGAPACSPERRDATGTYARGGVGVGVDAGVDAGGIQQAGVSTRAGRQRDEEHEA